jgi:hypothetical protein
VNQHVLKCRVDFFDIVDERTIVELCGPAIQEPAVHAVLVDRAQALRHSSRNCSSVLNNCMTTRPTPPNHPDYWTPPSPTPFFVRGPGIIDLTGNRFPLHAAALALVEGPPYGRSTLRSNTRRFPPMAKPPAQPPPHHYSQVATPLDSHTR